MKVLSFVKSKIAVASTALFVSASSFAAAESTGGTDYAGQAMDALLTQANDLIGKVWPVVVAVVGAGLAIRIFKKFASKAV
ncbi:major coat protein [Escherichia coli]|uniref:major coat protein n=1 Tax=Enterobacteriaceae TaxID=543 RepID=UPI0003EF2160|nr:MULTISPECIES: major coat protein [Enterobacteriaceae]EIX6927959.1 capsid protein [Salmonella enterica subsp. enterica serovar Bredeney]EFC1700664.1 capsid protein [Escherichia coli]EGJ9766554.1 capsid protein [Escherichia coli]EGM7727380.1 capsid protein [Escherichia coli]EHX1972064.1 capsid protein [Escherichia coli]